MADFLDEVTGDFVLHTRAQAAIDNLVVGRIYPCPPQHGDAPYLVYSQVDGHRPKHHGTVAEPSGMSAVRTCVLHVYAIAESQTAANELGRLVEERWLVAEGTVGSGTYVQVCNGGRDDCGQWHAIDSSDRKLFFMRVVLRFLIGR